MKNLKKIFSFFAISVLALVAFPSCSGEKTPQSRLDIIGEMTNVLASVHDSASADVAAEKIATLVASLEKFPETPAENVEIAQATVGSFAVQGMRLGKENYFGSEKLKNALEGKSQTHEQETPRAQ